MGFGFGVPFVPNNHCHKFRFSPKIQSVEVSLLPRQDKIVHRTAAKAGIMAAVCATPVLLYYKSD